MIKLRNIEEVYIPVVGSEVTAGPSVQLIHIPVADDKSSLVFQLPFDAYLRAIYLTITTAPLAGTASGLLQYIVAKYGATTTIGNGTEVSERFVLLAMTTTVVDTIKLVGKATILGNGTLLPIDTPCKINYQESGTIGDATRHQHTLHGVLVGIARNPGNRIG